MKKKIIIPIISVVILIIFFSSFIIWNNRTVSTITLDINPSIEINLNKKRKVKNVKALNEDAKEIVFNDMKNKTLEETFDILITNLIDKGYVDSENNIYVILHVDGVITNEEVANQIEFEFGKKDVHSEVIVVDNITEEDENLAKKYNITKAKASYINTISNNIDLEQLVDKSVNELKETKDTGNYCDKGYILEGTWCLKEINRVKATSGEACPRGYYEYNDKCFEEVSIQDTDKLYCGEEFELIENKCIRTISMEAEPYKYSCTSGEAKTRLEMNLTSSDAGDANDIVCVDLSKATHPISPCETHDGTEYTMSGGKCYWHRAPVIAAGCPGKLLVNGMCWDDASNILICEGYRDGKRYNNRSEYCENSIKYINPTVTEYKCEEGFTLDGNKCIKEEIEDAYHEHFCPSGYTKTDNDRCINYNKTTNKEFGYICEGENSRLKGDYCVTYEIIEAKHN